MKAGSSSRESLVDASLAVIAKAVAHVGAENVAALAISNQRETAIGWYRQTVSQLTPRSPGSAAAAPRFAMNCATAIKSSKSRP